MTDVFDRIEGELSAAAERLESPGASVPARRRGRLAAWFASHSALALIGGTIVVGGAGAAAAAVGVNFHATPSPPTHGVIPRGPREHRVRDLRYRLEMFPSLQVGQVGWCSLNEVRFSGGRWLGGTGCGAASRRAGPAYRGGYTYLNHPRGLFVTAIVDRSVAFAQLTTGQRIAPTDDPSLPNGWRAIVALPGESHDGKLHYRDAQGKPFPDAYSLDRSSLVPAQPFGASVAAIPTEAPCTIAAPSDLEPRRSRWLVDVQGVGKLPGYAFMACGQTVYRAGNAWVEVTTLLDASKPGDAEPAVLPSARRAPHAAGVVEIDATAPSYLFTKPVGSGASLPDSGTSAGDLASAKRVGKAWLVVRAKSRVLRERVLREVSVRAPG